MILLFFRHSRLARNDASPAAPQLLVVSDEDHALQQGLVKTLETQSAAGLAQTVSQYDHEAQLHIIALV